MFPPNQNPTKSFHSSKSSLSESNPVLPRPHGNNNNNMDSQICFIGPWDFAGRTALV